MEGLGTGLLDSLMTLIAFTPILWGLSKQIDVLPWIGEVDHALVWVAIISALGGTLLLAAVGIKLPGIEYDIKKKRLVMKELFVVKMTQYEQPRQQLVSYIIVYAEFTINLIFIIYILTQLNGVTFGNGDCTIFSFSTNNSYRCYYIRFCSANNQSFWKS